MPEVLWRAESRGGGGASARNALINNYCQWFNVNIMTVRVWISISLSTHRTPPHTVNINLRTLSLHVIRSSLIPPLYLSFSLTENRSANHVINVSFLKLLDVKICHSELLFKHIEHASALIFTKYDFSVTVFHLLLNEK